MKTCKLIFFKKAWEGKRVSLDALPSLLILQPKSWSEHNINHSRAAITICKTFQLNGKDSVSLLRHWWGSRKRRSALCKPDLPVLFLYLQDGEALVLCNGAYQRATEFCFAECVANSGFCYQASTSLPFFFKKTEYGHIAEFIGHNTELLCLLLFMKNAGRSNTNFGLCYSSWYVLLSAHKWLFFCLRN